MSLSYLNLLFQYLFNGFIQLNTFSYITLNFKLKMDQKMRTLKTWKKFGKTEKKLKKRVATCFMYKKKQLNFAVLNYFDCCCFENSATGFTQQFYLLHIIFFYNKSSFEIS